MLGPVMAAEAVAPIWFVHWLRAASTLVVVWMHLGIAYWMENAVHAPTAHVAPTPGAENLPAWRFLFGSFDVHLGYGTVAVGLFFLVSGFVIPMTLENRSVGRFAFARLFRVYPTWLVVLAMIAGVLVVHARVSGDPLGLPLRTWLLNAALVPDLGAVPFINPVSWTLLIEVKFYLLCAVLAATVGLRRALPIVATVVGLAVFAVFFHDQHAGLAVEHPWLWVATQAIAYDAPYLCLVFVGVCFYNHFRQVWSTPRFVVMAASCVIAMAVGLAAVHAEHEYRLAFFVALPLSILVFAAAYAFRDRFRPLRGVRLLADISYPLYLIHYMIGIQLIAALMFVGAPAELAVLAATATVLAFAWVVHRGVEQPSIRFGKSFRRTAPRG